MQNFEGLSFIQWFLYLVLRLLGNAGAIAGLSLIKLDCSFLAIGRSGNFVVQRLKIAVLIYYCEGLSFDLVSELIDYDINRYR
ncbi:MAG: hypothetical protein DCF22_25860 [Leptolyngbya sp.]|nr:MAG: hypothetical protein DCF22_25860 [Leptolyngbya sp.]